MRSGARQAVQHSDGLVAVVRLAENPAGGHDHRVGRQEDVVRGERFGIGVAFELRQEERHVVRRQSRGVALFDFVAVDERVVESAVAQQLLPPRRVRSQQQPVGA